MTFEQNALTVHIEFIMETFLNLLTLIRFSDHFWCLYRYIYRFMKQEELCAFYRDASVALVTPIRDG